ncbi:MAG: hypothetical protein KGJ86_05490, partial [Chloroflexota bacterium]|nr:hypothetical protein [Chloroflexota bacterium]
LPGLENARLSTAALTALDADIAWFHRYINGRHLSLVGICVGGSLALAAAARPENAGAIHAVVAIDPYAQVKDLMEAAATGQGPDAAGQPAPFDMAAWVRADLVRSVAGGTIRDEASRQAILAALARSPQTDPLEAFRQVPPNGLSPVAAAWWRILGNRDPAAFDALYQALPEDARAELAELSPLTNAARLSAPVLLAAPLNDFAFPAGEAPALERANSRRIRLIRSSALDHVTPSFGFSVLAGYWQLLRFAVEGNSLLR